MLLKLLYDVPQTYIAVFTWRTIPYHVVAILLTALLVLSGSDWYYFLHSRNALVQEISLYAAIGGFFVPILLPVLLIIYGEWKTDAFKLMLGRSIALSEATAYLVSISYKALTGRMQPEFLTQTSVIDSSRDFHFGFLQHGVFWGWPSSHAAVACASVAVIVLLVKNRGIRVTSFVYACFIVIGVSVSIHWLSDAIAGVIFGSLAGIIVVNSQKLRDNGVLPA